MNELFLFTDGSVNVKTNIGYGAALCVNNIKHPLDGLKRLVKVKRFENTSSTKLELQTLLWAFSKIETNNQKVIVYTDSQNSTQLLKRRSRLEQNNFCSKNGVLLKNYDLYVAFYKWIDCLNCEIVKIKGHQPSKNKNEIEQIFTLVDKASRKALREERS